MKNSKSLQKSMDNVQKFKRLLLNFPMFDRQKQADLKKCMTNDFVKLVIEICQNIMSKNLMLSGKDYERIKCYKRKMLWSPKQADTVQPT